MVVQIVDCSIRTVSNRASGQEFFWEITGFFCLHKERDSGYLQEIKLGSYKVTEVKYNIKYGATVLINSNRYTVSYIISYKLRTIAPGSDYRVLGAYKYKLRSTVAKIGRAHV